MNLPEKTSFTFSPLTYVKVSTSKNINKNVFFIDEHKIIFFISKFFRALFFKSNVYINLRSPIEMLKRSIKTIKPGNKIATEKKVTEILQQFLQNINSQLKKNNLKLSIEIDHKYRIIIPQDIQNKSKYLLTSQKILKLISSKLMENEITYIYQKQSHTTKAKDNLSSELPNKKQQKVIKRKSLKKHLNKIINFTKEKLEIPTENLFEKFFAKDLFIEKLEEIYATKAIISKKIASIQKDLINTFYALDQMQINPIGTLELPEINRYEQKILSAFSFSIFFLNTYISKKLLESNFSQSIIELLEKALDKHTKELQFLKDIPLADINYFREFIKIKIIELETIIQKNNKFIERYQKMLSQKEEKELELLQGLELFNSYTDKEFPHVFPYQEKQNKINETRNKLTDINLEIKELKTFFSNIKKQNEMILKTIETFQKAIIDIQNECKKKKWFAEHKISYKNFSKNFKKLFDLQIEEIQQLIKKIKITLDQYKKILKENELKKMLKLGVNF